MIKKVDSLSDTDVYFELSAIVAGMGDLHTSMMTGTSFDYISQTLFPISVQCFGGGFYLCGYQTGYEQLEPYLLREIVAVNGIDINYLERKVESIWSPGQSWAAKEAFAYRYFCLPAFFDWAGCDYREGYTFQILNENNEMESVEVPAISKVGFERGTWVIAEERRSLLYTKHGNWSEYFEDGGGYVYLSLTELDGADSETPWAQLFQEARDLMDAHPDCGKFIIDLRFLPMGSGDALDDIRQSVSVLDASAIQNTYVVTGGYTGSAAMECIAIFKEELGAITVGEPTGQFTDYFVQVNPQHTLLPRSQTSLWISNDWVDGTPITEEVYDENGRLYPWENTVLPDVYVYQDIEDVRQGKDSVIEWILAQ